MADETWREEAKCRDMPLRRFFPEQGESLSPARLVCNGGGESLPCPVRAECLEFALTLSGLADAGVWAGTTERQRRRIRRERRLADCTVDGRRVG